MFSPRLRVALLLPGKLEGSLSTAQQARVLLREKMASHLLAGTRDQGVDSPTLVAHQALPSPRALWPAVEATPDLQREIWLPAEEEVPCDKILPRTDTLPLQTAMEDAQTSTQEAKYVNMGGWEWGEGRGGTFVPKVRIMTLGRLSFDIY